MAMEMMLRRMKMKVTVHGFRSAFRDWAGNEFWHREAANNGVPEAQMMMDRLLTLAGPSIRVMVCAGRLRANEGDLLGSQTIASLNNYDANRAIVGATGIAARGIYDADEEAGAVSAAMIQRAAEAIVVADHSKFDQLAASIYSRWEAIDRLVTDQPPAGALALTLHESGTEVTVAAI
jgi:DeoR/GlpR family transcriptional regulator of sugar metabolism